MSGLAAGIRLAHFGRRVCIFERHNAVGGLNSFYSIDGRKFDVGLHAMTNFVRPGVKGTPLTKLLRQLRIEREEFQLCEQKRSRIAFGPRGEISLSFANDAEVLESEIASRFPSQIDGYRRLVARVREFDDAVLDSPAVSAREQVRECVGDPLLENMLFCPVMYYGSSQERDMDFSQFVTMFKALYLEGLARPVEGVRLILRVLLDRYRRSGGERRMKCGVKSIRSTGGRVSALVLDSGEEITADHVISSIGAAETDALLGEDAAGSRTGAPPGRLSFVETIAVYSREPSEFGWGEDTIVFFNDSNRFEYERPREEVSLSSGVICIPNNFRFPEGASLPEGLLRVTCLANYGLWTALSAGEYQTAKKSWFPRLQATARKFLPPVNQEALEAAGVTTDMFTPRTITHYTGHLDGAIYGSPVKFRTGETRLGNLYLCGTDQGYLGIIGAMLSGITMANRHVLRREA